jgi:plasmid stability protein
MANLSIRKLDDTIYKKLQLRAEKNAVSMEEEARRVLTQAVMAPESIGSIFTRCFGKENGIEISAPHRRKPHHPIKL